jgi:hypothetical protein
MSISWRLMAIAVLPCVVAAHTQAAPVTLQSGTYTTAAASTALPQLCAGSLAYPTHMTWQGGVAGAPQSASSGTPRIEQYRNGQLIAVYHSFVNDTGCAYLGGGQDVLNPASAARSGCGAFTRTHAYRLAMAGDSFLVYPAVYAGAINQPWFGPMWDSDADYSAGIFHNPDQVSIIGVTVNGVRPVILVGPSAPMGYNTLSQAPVYFDQSNGMVWDNIDVRNVGGQGGVAGIYIGAASNLTLKNLRVSGFASSNADGILGATNVAGSLTIDSAEIDHNGGTNGPSHDIYIGASQTDPNFTLTLSHSWLHDAYYGHLLKSRAQTTVLTANYLEGGLPLGHHDVAESYLADFPNGGTETIHNNVFSKTASGADSNATLIRFGEEGIRDTRPQSFDFENNTLIAFSATNGGGATLTPFGFFAGSLPGDQSFPATIATRIQKNLYTGFCAAPYLGDIAVAADFTDLTGNFHLRPQIISDESALAASESSFVTVIGTTTYSHQANTGPMRGNARIGARD